MKKMIAFTVLAAACSSSNRAKPDATATTDAPMRPPTVVVVAGDYTMGDPGKVVAIDVESQTITQTGPAMSVDDDPMIRHFGSNVYIVNRALSNITILDDQTLSLVTQISTGTGSNPQDIAVVGTSMYVPVFAGTGVVVLTLGTESMTTIDLSADDPDGKPNCNSAYAVGTNVYVACELLDDTNKNLPPRGPGKIYVIDPTTNTKTASFTMQNDNPFGIFQPLPSGDLVIPTTDFAGGGCVEKITTTDTPASAGCVVMNSQLGGFAYASGLSVLEGTGGDAVMFLAVSDYPAGNLQGFDLLDTTLWPAPLSPMTELIESIAACPDGEVVATDGTSATPGVRIYNGTTEKTAMPLDIGLPTINANAIVCY